MKPRDVAIVLAAALASCAQLPPAAPPPFGDRHFWEQVDERRLIVLAVANPPEPAPVHAGSSQRSYDTLPRYAAGMGARTSLAVVAEAYGLHPLAAWPIASLRLHCAVFKIPDGATRKALLLRLAQDPRVRLAQPLQDFTTLTSSYNDPYFALQQGFSEIQAAEAQQWSRGIGVRVALIDTGVDAGHPDLLGRVSLQRDFVGGDARSAATDRHGTEVAGVIAANANNRVGIVGVAPEVRLLSFKACWSLRADGDEARCNSFTLAQALSAAIESGAQIINLSLGGPADPLLEALLGHALEHGVIVVGAMPPGGRRVGFPSGLPGVIAVDTLDGTGAALRAPGNEVLTLTPGGHYDFASGSSLSAAYVSGAVALLLSRDAQLKPPAVAELLRGSGHDGARSGGAINICRALAAIAANLPDRSCAVMVAAPLGGGALHR